MTVQSESDAVKLAKERLPRIVAAAGLSHLRPKLQTAPTLWQLLTQRLRSQSFSPHYSHFLSVGGFETIASIVIDCVDLPFRLPDSNEPTTWVEAVDCLAYLMLWSRTYPNDPNAHIRPNLGNLFAPLNIALTSPGAWDPVSGVDAPGSARYRESLLALVVNLMRDSLRIPISPDLGLYFDALPPQIFMIQDVLQRDAAFRQSAASNANIPTLIFGQAYRRPGVRDRLATSMRSNGSSTLTRFTTALKALHASWEETTDIVLATEVVLVCDIVQLFSDPLEDAMNGSLVRIFDEQNGFQNMSKVVQNMRNVASNREHPIHQLYDGDWFSAPMEAWGHLIGCIAQFSLLSAAEAVIECKILYHLEWYMLSFALRREASNEEFEGGITATFTLFARMLIIVMGNSTSERRRREFRHQLLSSYRRYVGRRNTQGIPSPPPPPELFSERWLFPYEYINDLDQEPTCAAIACDTAWSEDMDMLRCVRCKKSYYCSKACQKRDWKSHKPDCFPA